MLERFRKTKQAILTTETFYQTKLLEQRRLFNRQVERYRRLRGGADDEEPSRKKQKREDGQSLKAILDIPGLPKELKRALGNDVRPMDEIRDPALYIQIEFVFFDCQNVDDFEEVHRIQLSSKANTYIVSKEVILTNPPGPYTVTDSLRNVVDGLLSKSMRGVKVLADSDVSGDCSFDMKVRFLFSERRLEKDIEKFSDEDIRHRLNILSRQFGWEISPKKQVIYSNGNTNDQNRSQRYQAGHFLPSEVDLAHRMFNDMYNYSVDKYNDNKERDIGPVLEDVVETFNDLVKGKVRLQPQKFPDQP